MPRAKHPPQGTTPLGLRPPGQTAHPLLRDRMRDGDLRQPGAYVNTVLGELPCEEMGVTYTHEHLLMNPGDPLKYGDSIFDEPAKIITELNEFKSAGGGTIVEMSPLNFGRDPAGYRELSKVTGVHIICATGFHKEEFIPAWVHSQSDEEIIQLLLCEIQNGIADTGIKPGVLKLGTGKTITPTEERLLGIVAQVHRLSGLPISTHTDRGMMALEQCRLLSAKGVDPSRVLLGHVDIPNDEAYLKQICALGFNVGIDHVGRELDTADRVKIHLIKGLIDGGFRDHIFLSGDMGKKQYLRSYGGKPGLHYIVTELSQNMRATGIAEEDIRHILIQNPQRLLCSQRPQPVKNGAQTQS